MSHLEYTRENIMEDKYAAQKKYAKSNIKKLSGSFPREFVDAFAQACRNQGIKQADIIRRAMQEVIDREEKNSLDLEHQSLQNEEN